MYSYWEVILERASTQCSAGTISKRYIFVHDGFVPVFCIVSAYGTRRENKPKASIHFFFFFLSICKSVLFILFCFFSLHRRPSIVAWTSIASISWRPSTSGFSTNSTRSRSWNSSWATTEGNFKICFFRFPPSPRLLCVFCEAKAKRGKQVRGWVYSNRGRCGGQAGGHQKKKERKRHAGAGLLTVMAFHWF